MFSKSAVAVALLAASVVAQNTTLPFAVSSISPADRASWCQGEQDTCGYLCVPGGTVDAKGVDGNLCDPDTLIYTCTCASNHSTPGLQYYLNSMPSFICQQVYKNCIAASGQVLAAQKKCEADRTANCGTLDATKFSPPAASSSSSSAAGTPTGAGTGTASTSASSSSSTGAAATMLAIGGEYGAGIVAAGVAAAFGLML